jgi:anthranilate phosphoribosyltransferase
VHAEDGLDEVSTLGPTRVSELQGGHVKTWQLDPRSLGLPYARLSDLQVETVDQAAEALRLILGGEKGPRRDIALLNAAAALVVAGASPDLPHAMMTATDSVDDGLANRTLQMLIRCSNA